MKRIGILGGISHHTTIEYYSRIMDQYAQRRGDLNYPEIIIYSLSHGKFKGYEDRNQMDKYADYISVGVESLIQSGAESIVLAANSPHRILETLQARFDIPFISALDSAFRAAMNQGIKKGLLLGIKFTMQASFYQERFRKGGIELITPNDAEQDAINEMIFHKMTNGKELDTETKTQMIEIISRYPVDGIVLGCMRLPIFFNDKTVEGLNIVNTLERHIEDILAFATQKEYR